MSLDQCIQRLCERIFVAEKENKISDYGKLSCGVARHSILRTLLFVTYVNEIPKVVKPNLF